MEKYNYREVIKADIREWMRYNYNHEYDDYDFDTMYEHLSNELWDEGEITGNSDYWYDSEYNCEQYLCHNFDLFFEALYYIKSCLF